MILFTLPTAFKTPFPIYLDLSPSLNSTASRSPVEAPLGTAALPIIPLSISTSTSTVGLPRESKISLPLTSIIVVIFIAVLIYVLRIVHNLQVISKIAKDETEKIVKDVEKARDDIKDGVDMTKKQIGVLVSGLAAQKMIKFFMSASRPTKSGTKKTNRQK